MNVARRGWVGVVRNLREGRRRCGGHTVVRSAGFSSSEHGKKILRVEEDDKNASGNDGIYNGELMSSVSSVRGGRLTMEDRFSVNSYKLAENNQSVFGVYDGHAGVRCSEYLSIAMPQMLEEKRSEIEQDPDDCLKLVFRELDDNFCSYAADNMWQDGSTSCVAIVNRDEVTGKVNNILCANTGDSRAIVVRKSGKVKQLSRDHVPTLEDERERIKAQGGTITFVQDVSAPEISGMDRVNGILAMTRAFGNYTMKPWVTAEPEISRRRVRKDDMYLCVATDGLWESCTNEMVASTLLEHGTRRGVQKLTDMSLSPFSDNITIIAVRLNW
eukprot:CAMPEP_0203802966 /NCGR_PEP_ID=MMETSP0100_2-20121128/12487_1 /ASSEMBLY_ACC=CAM_ASM_000210 /TAXON_ID=96639 /ORGANISM=" , Strain NY0313808BC1" /LENGTH=328 /DNA_ID=CAMNT_0050710461 /DNA_START=91 /DNA_END=1074 /DNA_ORIENTATION=+